MWARPVLSLGGRPARGFGVARWGEAAWSRVFAAYAVRVEADELLVSGDRVSPVGAYRGIERATGAALHASFAHVLTTSDGRIRALHQITDTRSWPSSQPQ
jgi:ketosteroid isomerase-like protein